MEQMYIGIGIGAAFFLSFAGAGLFIYLIKKGDKDESNN